MTIVETTVKCLCPVNQFIVCLDWWGSFLFMLKTFFIKTSTGSLVGRLFTNCLGNLGSTPDRVIPKTLKWYLILPCLTLSNIRYISRVKRSNTGNGVAPSPLPQCSSYWKGILRVALDYGRQLYLLYMASIYNSYLMIIIICLQLCGIKCSYLIWIIVDLHRVSISLVEFDVISTHVG